MKIHKLVVGELGTNCYIVVSAKDNAFIIDPGDEASKIKAFLNKNKIRPLFIINTHGHMDHIEADVDLGLPVYVHEKEKDIISDPQKNPMISFFGIFKPVIPAGLLKEDDKICLDEMKFKIIHTPGHTPGGICLLGDGLLFSGDTLFKDGAGRTDFPGASYELMQASLKKLSRLDKKTIVYPGHGPQTTIGDEFHNY